MSFKNFAIVAVAMCAFSCSDFDNDFKYSEVYKNHLFDEALKEYTTNFEARYGKMDPNHTWGFGNIVGDLATRTQVAEKNLWDEQYHLTVPGWPDSYYKSDGSYVVGLYHNSDESGNTYDSKEGKVPAGDVTDEEVQYVAWWFRTHRNPNSVEIHWSDFYIQEVCSDIDRDASGNKINYGTEYEKKNGAWVQSKYTLNQWGIDQLLVKTLQDEPGLMTLALNNDVPGNYDEEGYDHIYNFNSGHSDNLESIETVPMTSPWGEGNSNLDAANGYKSAGDFAGKTDKRLIAFYQNSGTEDFKAHYSNDERWRSNFQDRNIWVIVHLHFTGASGRVYDGYYLGFDYAFYKEAEFDENNVCKKYQVIYPDGYYSNWIVKISPASPIVTTEEGGFSRRIMCEDLGNSYDLDFDDIVFDVTYNITQKQLNDYENNSSLIPAEGIDVTINLQAAGGTMPISVGKEIGANGGSYEAHRLFGLGDNYQTPVNVSKGINAPVANYHIKVKNLDPDNIPIYVYNTKIGKLITLNKSGNGVSGNYDTTNKKNNAPQKFAVPTSVLWLQEEKQIEDGYQYFANWVQNASFKNNNKEWFDDDNITSNGKTLLCGTRGSYTYTISSSGSSSSASSDCVVPVNTTPAKLEYRLDTKTNNAEWGTVTAPQYVEAGHSATVSATPKEGCTFLKWSDGNTDNPRQITVNTLTTLMAHFKSPSGANGYTVTISGENATTEITSTQSLGDDYYAENGVYNDAQINLNCTVDENNYIFVGWYVNGEFYAKEKNCNVKITANANEGYQQNLTIVAKAAPKYNMPIIVKVYDTDGITPITDYVQDCSITIGYDPYYNISNGTVTCYVGKTLQYTIASTGNYEFVGWSLGDKPDPSGSITVTKDMQLTVTFKKKAAEQEETQQPEEVSKKRVHRRK